MHNAQCTMHNNAQYSSHNSLAASSSLSLSLSSMRAQLVARTVGSATTLALSLYVGLILHPLKLHPPSCCHPILLLYLIWSWSILVSRALTLTHISTGTFSTFSNSSHVTTLAHWKNARVRVETKRHAFAFGREALDFARAAPDARAVVLVEEVEPYE